MLTRLLGNLRLSSFKVLSEEKDDLEATLSALGIVLKPVMYKMDVRPLLKAVLDQFFGKATGLVDMIVEHIPSAAEGSAEKVKPYVWARYHHSCRPTLTGAAELLWSSGV